MSTFSTLMRYNLQTIIYKLYANFCRYIDKDADHLILAVTLTPKFISNAAKRVFTKP